MLIWASNKDRRNPALPLHTNFAISSSGEEVLITHPGGERIDEMEPIEIPTDISRGRYPDGTGDFVYFQNPTPGAPNTNGTGDGITQPPVFSLEPGFYSDTITLEITHSDPSALIYYTTDGRTPDTTSTLYTGPVELASREDDPNYFSMIRTNPPEADDMGYGWIEPDGNVDKGNVIRAIAVAPESIPSEEISGTWFIGIDNPAELPVFSIQVDEEHFFSDETGIYVPGDVYNELGWPGNVWGDPNANYFERGIEWEREGRLEFYKDGAPVMLRTAGFRIHGGGSRVMPMKSLRLYARNAYGDRNFEYPFFDDPRYNSYRRLILRNSGQDFYNRATMFRDAFMQKLVGDMNFDTQAYMPSIVFLNGEYWGIHNLRERYDRHYFERVHGVPEGELDYLTGENTIKEGSKQHYLSMISFIQNNDLADDSNLEHLSQMMDLDNYTDYLIANVFIRNNDWPANNIDFWRYSGHVPEGYEGTLDGRWRWVLFDTDFGYGQSGGNSAHEMNMLAFITNPEGDNYANQPWSTLIIRNLFENQSFKEQFAIRFSDLMNSVFKTSRAEILIDEMSEVIEPEIYRHLKRWGYPQSYSFWVAMVNSMKHFAEKRPEYQWDHLTEFMEADGRSDITIEVNNPSAGSVRINTINITPETPGLDDPSNLYPWTGTYINGIPVTLTAIERPGYYFTHWEIDDEEIEEYEIVLLPEDASGTFIKAHFEAEADPFPDAFPQAWKFGDEQTFWSFNEWDADMPAGTYPENMAFVYMDEDDPGIEAEIAGFTSGAFNLTSRTRINGLGDNGFAFINTGNSDGNPGYPGTRLGGAILALDTRGQDELELSFTAGTVLPNSREYAIVVQYRAGDEGPFQTLTFPDGSPVIYERSEEEGHTREIGPVYLPSEIQNLPYVQLLWRYYYTGIRHDEDSGQRSKLNISQITVSNGSDVPIDDDPPQTPQQVSLDQNFPNPFNPSTVIRFTLPEQMHARLSVYNIMGQRVTVLTDRVLRSGKHQIAFDGTNLSSGVYLYVLETPEARLTRKMLLVK